MISKKMINALKAISPSTSDIKKNYQNIRNFQKMSNTFSDSIQNGYIFADGNINDVPVRVFYPDNMINNDVIIYFHGGGWVIGDIISYSSVCAEMCIQTSRRVIAVDYKLAPENKFPIAVDEAYDLCETIAYHKDNLEINPERIILAGDSAGGNIVASVNLMASDRGKSIADMQILIYPVTSYDYTENSAFKSVSEFRDEYFLTAKRMNDYVELYAENEDDCKNPYFSPVLHENPVNQPDTLLITAEYDILRDEGEEYAEKLLKYGNKVEFHRIGDALHGFIVLPTKFKAVSECYNYIRKFIDGGERISDDSRTEME